MLDDAQVFDRKEEERAARKEKEKAEKKKKTADKNKASKSSSPYDHMDEGTAEERKKRTKKEGRKERKEKERTLCIEVGYVVGGYIKPAAGVAIGIKEGDGPENKKPSGLSGLFLHWPI